jgi:lysophospholipase L1-like esterase
MRRLLFWYLPAAAAIAAGAILAAGFIDALAGRTGTPVPPAPATAAPVVPGPPGSLSLVALGDSLTRGTGDERGGGYVDAVAEGLRKAGTNVAVTNLAVNGAESSDLLAMLRRTNVRRICAGAGRILLSIGGNDLAHAAESARAPQPEAITRVLDGYRTRLSAILTALRSANPGAPIDVLGLYNPAAAAEPPEPASPAAAFARLGSHVVARWNAAMEETALGFPDVTVIPVFDLFERHPDRLSADRFHPDHRGYQLIAERILQTVPMSAPASQPQGLK